jgi:hypothetical protein
MNSLFDKQAELNDTSSEEREHSRVIEILKTHLQPPQSPSSADKAQIVRHLHDNGPLTSFRNSGIEQFLANTGLLPDGRVICTIQATLLDSSDGRFLPLSWGSKFGSCVRLLLPTRRIPTQAVFIPGEKLFDALQSNRLVFAFFRLSRIQNIIEFDLASSEEAKSAFAHLLLLTQQGHSEIAKVDRYIFDPVLVRANSVSEKYFSKYWTRLEWLQRGWINACARRSYYCFPWIDEAKTEISTASQLPFLRRFDLLYETISILNKTELSKSDRVTEILKNYKRRPIVELPVELVAFDRESSTINEDDALATRRAGVVAHEIWELLELDAELSDWGRCQISWDTLGEEIPPAVIDPNGFPIERDDEAASYWEWKRPGISPNRNRLLSPSDLQLDPGSFAEGFSNWGFDIEDNEAKETITDLLNEAVALREWTIPPNAFVELQVGPFVGAEVTEIGKDVFFIWRSANNRYWEMSVDTEQSFANTEIFTRDTVLNETTDRMDRKAQLSIQLLMAAIIRDFWIATEREKIFGVKKRRGTQQRNDKFQSRVVYLPRVRYVGSKIDLHGLNLGLSYKARSQHYVRPFYRKANPSRLQIEIATRARVILPEGHTYVRGHYRGIEGTEGQTVYRSRSAIKLLFEAHDPDDISTTLASTDWFEFERAVSTLLEKYFNFSILHRAPRDKPDYGIDILATKQMGAHLETWTIQCKCYKPSNLVEPSHIRELLGAMSDTKADGTNLVRGMMVTTSRFSGEALRLAVKHGIQCISGEDLNAIMNAINASNSAPLTH